MADLGRHKLRCKLPISREMKSCQDRIIKKRVKEDEEIASARIRVACVISQLICSNATKRCSEANTLYHARDKEIPLPLYLGLKLHFNDRQKEMINSFHSHGLLVPYDVLWKLEKP